jgi:hypothetical protein
MKLKIKLYDPTGIESEGIWSSSKQHLTYLLSEFFSETFFIERDSHDVVVLKIIRKKIQWTLAKTQIKRRQMIL